MSAFPPSRGVSASIATLIAAAALTASSSEPQRAGSTPWVLETAIGRELVVRYIVPTGKGYEAQFAGVEAIETTESVTITVRQTVSITPEASGWFGFSAVVPIQLDTPLADRALLHGPVSDDLSAF